MGAWVLWIDQCEFYLVCPACYNANVESRWSGNTNPFKGSDWGKRRKEIYELAAKATHCEMCKEPIRSEEDETLQS